jgi:hypothetical protein
VAGWAKDHAKAECAGLRQGKAQAVRLSLEKGVGNPYQYPGTVSGDAVTPCRSTMAEIEQDLPAMVNNCVSGAAGDVDNRPDPATVMLVSTLV